MIHSSFVTDAIKIVKIRTIEVTRDQKSITDIKEINIHQIKESYRTQSFIN